MTFTYSERICSISFFSFLWNGGKSVYLLSKDHFFFPFLKNLRITLCRPTVSEFFVKVLSSVYICMLTPLYLLTPEMHGSFLQHLGNRNSYRIVFGSIMWFLSRKWPTSLISLDSKSFYLTSCRRKSMGKDVMKQILNGNYRTWKILTPISFCFLIILIIYLTWYSLCSTLMFAEMYFVLDYVVFIL